MSTVKPRLLHVITGLDVGGAEMMLVKTLPRLPEFEHLVCTILSPGQLSAQLTEAGIKVVSLDAQKKGYFQAIKTFYQLRSYRPQLCISYLIHADLFVRVWGTIFGFRPRITFIRNNLIGSKYDRLLRMERLSQWLVDGYFSVSGAVARLYIEKLDYPKEKFTVIPNGIVLTPLLEAKPFAKKELGLKDDNIMILTVAKFFEQKGHRYLIDAWSAVSKKRPEARLLLVGAGPIQPEIERLVAERHLENSISFLGVRDDIPRLLKTCDLFVFPTLFEGMSNALLEAMAASCAIVTTNIPENQEVATDQEVCFVAPADSQALSQAIIELLSKPKLLEPLRRRAVIKVTQEFSIEQTVAKLRSAYRRYMSNGQY